MASVRAALQTAFPTATDLDLRKIGCDWGLPYPISIRTMIAPESVTCRTTDDGGMWSAGSLEGWAEWELRSNGWWVYRGSLDSHALIIGDRYVFVMAQTFVDESGQGFSVSHSGDISPRSSDTWSDGPVQSPWLARNWQNLKNSGFTWTGDLHTDPDSSGPEYSGGDQGDQGDEEDD